MCCEEMYIYMGKFVVKHTKTGIKFDLKATNGQVIATSEVYNSKDACMNGIESVKDQTVENFEKQKNPKFQVFKDKAGEFRFNLTAKNGQIIAVSEGYKTMANCIGGVESVISNAPDAPVEELADQ